MAFKVADRAKETSTSTGNGVFNLAGAPTGFVTLNSAVGVGYDFTYAIVHQTLNEWEVGLGYLNAPTQITRSVIYSGTSGAGTPVSFSAGTKDVFITQAAGASNWGITLGETNSVATQWSIVIGKDAGTSTSSVATTTVGWGAGAGRNTALDASNGVSIGREANCWNERTTAVGYNSVAGDPAGSGWFNTGAYATSIGSETQAKGSYSLSIGSGGIANSNYTMVFGPVIGNDANAVYFYNFRTGIPAVGTQYTLKWDSTSKEVVADSGGGGGGATLAKCAFNIFGSVTVAGATNNNCASVVIIGLGRVAVNFTTPISSAAPAVVSVIDPSSSGAYRATNDPAATPGVIVYFYDVTDNWNFPGYPLGANLVVPA